MYTCTLTERFFLLIPTCQTCSHSALPQGLGQMALPPPALLSPSAPTLCSVFESCGAWTTSLVVTHARPIFFSTTCSRSVSPAKARAVFVYIAVAEHLSESLHTVSIPHLLLAGKFGLHSFCYSQILLNAL